MKIAVTGKPSPELDALLKQNGIMPVRPEEAELLICFGGDGSFLGAEQKYPGLPKYPIRDTENAPLCPKHTLEIQLKAFLEGRLKRTFLPKLFARLPSGREIFGINDIFIHNRNNASALRYRVWIDDELYAREIVGDGAGLATVHGSTGYYRSITRSLFRTGLGLAFSNSTELVNHMVLPENSCVRIRITRGPAEIVADNTGNFPVLQNGEECLLGLSERKTEVTGLECFMCPECRRLRHHFRRDFTPEGISGL